MGIQRFLYWFFVSQKWCNGVIQHIDKGSDAIDPAASFGACSLLQHKKQ
jgi:hypothetical protein